MTVSLYLICSKSNVWGGVEDPWWPLVSSKALQRSMTQTWELLGGMEVNSVFLTTIYPHLFNCLCPPCYIHTPPPMTGGTGAPLIILSLFQFHTHFTSHYRQKMDALLRHHQPKQWRVTHRRNSGLAPFTSMITCEMDFYNSNSLKTSQKMRALGLRVNM